MGAVEAHKAVLPITTGVSGDLWEVFTQHLEALGGKLLATIPNLEGRSVWDETGEFSSTDLWSAEIGVSRAEFAIAETGTLVFSAGPQRARLSSLVPPINLVLVSDIVPTFAEGIARIGARTSVLVTGPSRTADIEGILVRGVHGPGELWAVRV